MPTILSKAAQIQPFLGLLLCAAALTAGAHALAAGIGWGALMMLANLYGFVAMQRRNPLAEARPTWLGMWFSLKTVVFGSILFVLILSGVSALGLAIGLSTLILSLMLSLVQLLHFGAPARPKVV